MTKFSINLTPAQDVLDGRQLPALVQLWLQHTGQRADVTAHTLEGYTNRVAYFVRWWEEYGPACGWELTRIRVQTFGEWLQTAETQYGRPLEYNSQQDILKRLRQCFKWAYDNDYLPRDVTPWVPMAVGSAPLRQRATLDELAALMLAAAQSNASVRNEALLAIYVGTGLRKAEAVALDIEDLRINADQSGTAVVRKAKRVRKRQVQARVIAFDRWTGHYLARLIDTYEVQRGPLFRNKFGQRLGEMSAYVTVKNAIARAGLEGKIEGPHDLRRNFATWFSKTHRGEMYGRLLSKQLGHAAFSMTDHYILHDADDLLEVIESPLAQYTMPTRPDQVVEPMEKIAK